MSEAGLEAAVSRLSWLLWSTDRPDRFLAQVHAVRVLGEKGDRWVMGDGMSPGRWFTPAGGWSQWVGEAERFTLAQAAALGEGLVLQVGADMAKRDERLDPGTFRVSATGRPEVEG